MADREYRKTVYCELEFLKKFRSSFPRSLGVREELVEQWWNVSRFINKAELELDVSKEEFLKAVKRNDYLMKVFKRGIERNIKFLNGQTASDRCTEDTEANTVSGLKIAYMLDINKADGQVYEQKKGIIVLTPTSWKTQEYLFGDNGSAVEKYDAEITSWKGILLNRYKLSNCNSILIIDKYLLSKDINNFNNTNLYYIFDALLPQKLLNSKFHITIITDKKEKVNNCSKKYEIIDKGIRKLRPDLEYMFEILCPQECPFHDRTIITNNVWIGCGAGFDLFNSRGATQNTTITIVYPGIQNSMDWCEKAYQTLIDKASEQARKIKDGCGGECFSKNSQFHNRLLSQ